MRAKQNPLVCAHVRLILYVAKEFEHVLAVAVGKKYEVSSPTVGLSPYKAKAVEHVLGLAFGMKLLLFESHCHHITLCS